jgi:hypothetical protein
MNIKQFFKTLLCNKNTNNKNTKNNVAIFVVYAGGKVNKKDNNTFLFKNDIFKPIYAGIQCDLNKLPLQPVYKDPVYPESFLNADYIKSIMLTDDYGDENISYLNRKINEYTAIYSIYKNIDKFKDKDYIGFCHYKRFLDFSHMLQGNKIKFNNQQEYLKYCSQNTSKIISNINNYSIVSFVWPNIHPTQNFSQYHLKDFLNQDFLDYIKINNPQLYPSFNHYVNNVNNMYMANLFIMKKDLFLEYCEFIFELGFYFLANLDIKSLTFSDNLANNSEIMRNRVVGHIMERATSCYINYLIEGRKIKTQTIKDFHYLEN